MHSHVSLADARLTPLDTRVTVEQCLEAKKFAQLSINPKQTIPAKMNKTTHTRMYVVGRVTGNGECQGGNAPIGGVDYSNIAVYKEFTLTVVSYLALFDSNTDVMFTNGYGFCKLSDNSCHTGHSTLLFDPIASTCSLLHLKSVEFTETRGQ